MLFRYVRKPDGRKIGVLVAKEVDGRVIIGWSKCHNSLDKFDRETGVELATDRIFKGVLRKDRIVEASPEVLPHSLRVAFNRFHAACKRYFHREDIFVVTAANHRATSGDPVFYSQWDIYPLLADLLKPHIQNQSVGQISHGDTNATEIVSVPNEQEKAVVNANA